MGVAAPFFPISLGASARPTTADSVSPPPLSPPRKGEGNCVTVFVGGCSAVFAAILLLTANPASAQDRTPTQRQALTDLAYVLGQSHALRQACQGATDQFWRGRMVKLVEAEAPDPAFNTRLNNAFNAGFSSAQAQYPSCDPDSRRAEAAAAAHGQSLASSLAKPMADDQTVR